MAKAIVGRFGLLNYRDRHFPLGPLGHFRDLNAFEKTRKYHEAGVRADTGFLKVLALINKGKTSKKCQNDRF